MVPSSRLVCRRRFEKGGEAIEYDANDRVALKVQERMVGPEAAKDCLLLGCPSWSQKKMQSCTEALA